MTDSWWRGRGNPDLVLVQASANNASNSVLPLTAHCPPGTTVIDGGGAAYSNPDQPRAMLTGMRLVTGGFAVTARTTPTGGGGFTVPPNRQLWVSAICGRGPTDWQLNLYGTCTDALPHAVRVASSTLGIEGWEAVCPTGAQSFGTGGARPGMTAMGETESWGVCALVA
ncbi:hypothetical protein JQS43_02465 [Natronosporangium hydrolyticum]|uniref:Uncharacterized protein n=1 Tax=Natronosporangium hydrolyticum TaxID=2811111 RepID=A0A895YMV3_9ACTN|nr:hypothetical protein [Natronosporangium hydrolyticum]QSB15248.1 hypothetical protein JQS43_02465 [Natronosporangium hydrolyticum]